MTSGVVDSQAEVATALVEVQRARLENGFFLAPVKIGEVDEVVEEGAEIAVVADEAFDVADGLELRLPRKVARDEGGEGGDDRLAIRPLRMRPDFVAPRPAAPSWC